MRTSRRPICQRLGHPFADHLSRRLVVPEAEEAGVAQSAVARPLGEADLGDELRLDPCHVAFLDRLWCGERRVGSRAVSQPRAQVVEGVGVEPGPDLAGVLEPAVAVVAEQQRAELDARASRLGVAADHELLAVFALELQPVL